MALLDTLPGRAAVVNTTAASFPFLARLASKDRVVVTVTETAVQQYDIVFPGFFVQAFVDMVADTDRNGRVSIWEAFEFAQWSRPSLVSAAGPPGHRTLRSRRHRGRRWQRSRPAGCRRCARRAVLCGGRRRSNVCHHRSDARLLGE